MPEILLTGKLAQRAQVPKEHLEGRWDENVPRRRRSDAPRRRPGSSWYKSMRHAFLKSDAIGVQPADSSKEDVEEIAAALFHLAQAGGNEDTPKPRNAEHVQASLHSRRKRARKPSKNYQGFIESDDLDQVLEDLDAEDEYLAKRGPKSLRGDNGFDTGEVVEEEEAMHRDSINTLPRSTTDLFRVNTGHPSASAEGTGLRPLPLSSIGRLNVSRFNPGANHVAISNFIQWHKINSARITSKHHSQVITTLPHMGLGQPSPHSLSLPSQPGSMHGHMQPSLPLRPHYPGSTMLHRPPMASTPQVDSTMRPPPVAAAGSLVGALPQIGGVRSLSELSEALSVLMERQKYIDAGVRAPASQPHGAPVLTATRPPLPKPQDSSALVSHVVESLRGFLSQSQQPLARENGDLPHGEVPKLPEQVPLASQGARPNKSSLSLVFDSTKNAVTVVPRVLATNGLQPSTLARQAPCGAEDQPAGQGGPPVSIEAIRSLLEKFSTYMPDIMMAAQDSLNQRQPGPEERQLKNEETTDARDGTGKEVKAPDDKEAVLAAEVSHVHDKRESIDEPSADQVVAEQPP